MTQAARGELANSIRSRYSAASGKAKRRILDEFIAASGYHEKSAIRVLNIDFATISQLLGHSGLQTTMRYARADLDLKRQALSQVFPDALGAPKAGGMALHGTELTRWLRRL
jgi:integrase